MCELMGYGGLGGPVDGPDASPEVRAEVERRKLLERQCRYHPRSVGNVQWEGDNTPDDRRWGRMAEEPYHVAESVGSADSDRLDDVFLLPTGGGKI